jgi:hypothetical protein
LVVIYEAYHDARSLEHKVCLRYVRVSGRLVGLLALVLKVYNLYLNLTELRCDPEKGCSENYNEELDSVDGVEILGQLSNYELLKKHSA